jgi:hypothetical protein
LPAISDTPSPLYGRSRIQNQINTVTTNVVPVTLLVSFGIILLPEEIIEDYKHHRDYSARI